MKIVILGSGMMGSAFAVPLLDRGHEVCLVGTHLDGAIIAELRESGRHLTLGIDLPQAIKPFPIAELSSAMRDADAVVLGVSSAGIEWAASTLAPYLDRALPLLMLSKGLRLEGARLLTLPEAFVQSLPDTARNFVSPVAVGGPCIAGELARRVPTTVVFAARAEQACKTWKEWAEGGYYHVRTSSDETGVEVCAALKNAYAVGVALAIGVHEASGGAPGSVAMHNYEAAVFAQAVQEMAQLVELAGGSREQAFGLPGAGDLTVTCNGGRTGRFGRLLGLGIGRDEAIRRMQGATLESLEILELMRRALQGFAQQNRITKNSLPLLKHLIEVALDDKPLGMPFEAFFAGD